MIPRYTLPEMEAVWSEQAKLDGWTRVEVLAPGTLPRTEFKAKRIKDLRQKG